MKQFSIVLAASFAMIAATACGAAGSDGEQSGITADETGTVSSALTPQCDVANGRVQCFVTAIATVSDGMSNRAVYYRIGANTGTGFDAATGRHAAVFLFQGTSVFAGGIPNGGRNGPGATWSTQNPTVSRSLAPSAEFGGFYQVATVAALVNAGYTVIQPAARQQSNGAFFWDANQPNWNENPTGGTDAPDQVLMDNLVLRLQPGNTTFGAIDINHVYAMGISSGGFMTSRIANEYAGGVNNDSTVVSTLKPFRAVLIHSAGYGSCGASGCTIPVPLPNPANPPTFLMHGSNPDPVVPPAFSTNYQVALTTQFPSGNPAYTVNGVPQEFVKLVTFVGDIGIAGLTRGHQWNDDPGVLTGTSTNAILQWFNSHR